MIDNIKIKNYKSIVDLELELGTFNVLIGENGCGKSNILEAIAFGGAASADKLDYEFLGSRGVRVTYPEFMFSAFENGKSNKSICLDFKTNENLYEFDLKIDIQNRWYNKNKDLAINEIDKLFDKYFFSSEDDTRMIVNDDPEDYIKLKQLRELFNDSKSDTDFKKVFPGLISTIFERLFSHENISEFIVYRPEESRLRKFEESSQILPLGIHGEGLFQYLKQLAFNSKNKGTLKNLKDQLSILDWYDDFLIPKNLLSNEFSLRIKDKYLSDKLQFFDHRSTNEGFLFLLFYFTLFISKDTPRFFAIDNIEASFNPKLCVEITRRLAQLAKKNKKQVIITTHNPAILDGLNLKDEKQRLFVVRRNEMGHTKAVQIKYNKDRRMKLSEIWTKGFIGGLPENF